MTKYELPEKCANMTVHFLYGTAPSNPDSVIAYLKEKKYALIADLVNEGLTKEKIEQAVREDKVKVAPVSSKRMSDLFWLPEYESELEEMAKKAQKLCGGDCKDGNAPIGGDVLSLGADFDSQQLALVALTYAAHKGYVKETEIDRGAGVGPLFVSSESPLIKLLGIE